MKTKASIMVFAAVVSWAVAIGAESGARRSWCDGLRDSPGTLYESEDNPWVQGIALGGRFHYQAAHVEGKDVDGRKFHDDHDEYRRFRLDAEIEFLRFFMAEVSSNMVEDSRFRDDPPRELDWGHQDFNELTLELDLDNLLELEGLDKLELTYGRMKMPVGEELHQSSRHILTIERSSLSSQMDPETNRPTGVVLALGKGDWELDLGLFSTDDDSEGLASWNGGLTYYLSAAWEPGDFRFVLDHVVNDPSGDDPGSGYDWVSSLAASYDDGPWGVLVNVAYGENGGADQGSPEPDRQGRFHGLWVMPWYWSVEDRLQVVASCEWLRSERAEGLRLGSRYIRAQHDNPAIDLDGGRGDGIQSVYLGLNYLLCDQNAKIMAGVSHTRLDARQGDPSATTWMLAFRSYF